MRFFLVRETCFLSVPPHLSAAIILSVCRIIAEGESAQEIHDHPVALQVRQGVSELLT